MEDVWRSRFTPIQVWYTSRDAGWKIDGRLHRGWVCFPLQKLAKASLQPASRKHKAFVTPFQGTFRLPIGRLQECLSVWGAQWKKEKRDADFSLNPTLFEDLPMGTVLYGDPTGRLYTGESLTALKEWEEHSHSLWWEALRHHSYEAEVLVDGFFHGDVVLPPQGDLPTFVWKAAYGWMRLLPIAGRTCFKNFNASKERVWLAIEQHGAMVKEGTIYHHKVGFLDDGGITLKRTLLDAAVIQAHPEWEAIHPLTYSSGSVSAFWHIPEDQWERFVPVRT